MSKLNENNVETDDPSWGLIRIGKSALPLKKDSLTLEYAVEEVNVYFLDSGIKYSHPDLLGRAELGYVDRL
ncbi:hypothetical protein HCA06_14625 [Listeria welshimeri]|nr:hypothetical protein [Listeria welshimeri]